MNQCLLNLTADLPLPKQIDAVLQGVSPTVRKQITSSVKDPAPDDRYDIYAQVMDDLGEND